MKKLIILGSLIVGTTQAENLTDVLNVALDKDPQLSAARYTQLASEENKKQAWANFLPQVSGSWSKNESRSTREDRFLGTSVPRDVPDSQSESWQVTLNQAIYNHSNTLAVKQANLEKAKGFVDFELVKQDFLIRVAQSYFDVLTNIDAVKFAQAEEKAIQRQLDQAEQRYEVGLAAITDVHEARAQYDNSRASVINAKNILDDTKEALFEISQQYYQSLTALPDEIGQISLGNNALEDWEKIALKNNPDLGTAKITAELAELNIKQQRAGHYPDLSFSLSHRNNLNTGIAIRDQDTQEILFVLDSLSTNTSASINLNVPIFTGGKTTSLTKQAKLRYSAAMENLDRSNLTTIRSMRSSIHNVKAGWSTVQARGLAVVSATSAEEATTAGFEVGTRNIVEVLNAQRTLYQAQRDFSRAKHDYLMQVLKLKRAAGIISTQDIEEINQLLTVE